MTFFVKKMICGRICFKISSWILDVKYKKGSKYLQGISVYSVYRMMETVILSLHIGPLITAVLLDRLYFRNISTFSANRYSDRLKNWLRNLKQSNCPHPLNILLPYHFCPISLSVAQHGTHKGGLNCRHHKELIILGWTTEPWKTPNHLQGTFCDIVSMHVGINDL